MEVDSLLRAEPHQPELEIKACRRNDRGSVRGLLERDAPMIDLHGLARTWIDASDQQRSAWLAANARRRSSNLRAQARPEATHSIPGDAWRDHHDGSRVKRRCRRP